MFGIIGEALENLINSGVSDVTIRADKDTGQVTCQVYYFGFKGEEEKDGEMVEKVIPPRVDTLKYSYTSENIPEAKASTEQKPEQTPSSEKQHK